MTKIKGQEQSPTKGIWLRFLVLIPLLVVLVIVSRAYIRSVCSSFEAWTPVYLQDMSFDDCDVGDVRITTPNVVKATAVAHGANGAACVTFEAISDGETGVFFGKASGSEGPSQMQWHLKVQDGAIFEGADFTGWESIHICICIFLSVLSALFASVVVQLWRRPWYGYEMVACGGGLLFSLFQLVFFLYLLLHESLISFSDLAYQVTHMADWFVMLSFLPMGVMALLVSLSNISLIRHEGRRPVNLLGIAVSVFWLTAMVFWNYLWQVGVDLSLSYEALQFLDAMTAVAITYGECLLLSTIVCAWLASKHMPKHGADYVVVLGCGIRADGTPSPLLAGRVDKALMFDRGRVQAGDAPATFVPSGGQGPDEVTSEAQSMRDYLLSKGVEPNRVVLEDRSATTRENMAFSREVIEGHAGCDASSLDIVFSTTNYHVFRGYVCAHQAKMTVEGIGSKTKAYFWPNAFLREFAGLLVTKWRGILYTYAIIVVIYVLAEYILIID